MGADNILNHPHAASEGLFARLEGKLGVTNIRSDRDLVALVENRLSPTAVKALVRSGLTDAEAWHLIVPRRTLAHRIARHEPLSTEESDKAVRVARITAMAERAFGDAERAWRWMREPKRRFDGRAPLELLATEAGSRVVEETLTCIDNGLPA
jgi:putative toxin-antitoxin system antitoxin component (TIGR02293 family)